MSRAFDNQVSAKSAEIQACSCDLMNKVEAEAEDVQLFPPGDHKITAKMDGKPVELDVKIGEEQAGVIKRDFDKMLAEAKAGKGPMPFLDFNHEDRDAAAWPKEVFWAGNDPVSGGIRAKLEWTRAGKESVAGKSFRQFSPNFLIDTRTKQIIGTTPNMGGLVNRPAFRAIQPFFAKDGEEKPNQQPTMNKLIQLLASLGLVTAADASEDAAIADVTKSFAVIKAKADSAANLQTDVTGVQAKLAEVTAKLAEVSEASAERQVAQAIVEGRIAAKDEPTRKMWKDLIVADHRNATLLGTVAAVQTTDPTKRIITAGSPAAATPPAASEDGHPLVVMAREIAKRDKLSESAALVKAADENPKLYDSYRTALVSARN